MRSWSAVPRRGLQAQCSGTGALAWPRPSALVGEDAWLWALSAPQPGIRDAEEEKREGGLVADLGNTRVLYSKDRHAARPRAAELQPPESKQGGNWADPMGLAFDNVEAQLGKGNFSQTAEVSLRSDRDRSWPGGRGRRPSILCPCCQLRGQPCLSVRLRRPWAMENAGGGQES